jgi:hypothetical protein
MAEYHNTCGRCSRDHSGDAGDLLFVHRGARSCSFNGPCRDLAQHHSGDVGMPRLVETVQMASSIGYLKVAVLQEYLKIVDGETRRHSDRNSMNSIKVKCSN